MPSVESAASLGLPVLRPQDVKKVPTCIGQGFSACMATHDFKMRIRPPKSVGPSPLNPPSAVFRVFPGLPGSVSPISSDPG